jgi:hypothetical protein
MTGNSKDNKIYFFNFAAVSFEKNRLQGLKKNSNTIIREEEIRFNPNI